MAWPHACRRILAKFGQNLDFSRPPSTCFPLVNSSLTTSGISSQMSGLKISNDTASTHSSKDSYNRGSGSIPTSPTNWNLAGTLNRQVKPSDFEFLKVIGKGSYGKVLLAQDRRTKSFYAVKVLNKQTIINKNEQYHIMAERNVLSKNLSHPFLVSLHYSFQTPEKLYFVLDYANGGELFFHLQKEKVFSEVRARFYAAEIGSAIGYMHTQDIGEVEGQFLLTKR